MAGWPGGEESGNGCMYGVEGEKGGVDGFGGVVFGGWVQMCVAAKKELSVW